MMKGESGMDLAVRMVFEQGRPMWRFEDGTLLPVVAGGSDPGVPPPAGPPGVVIGDPPPTGAPPAGGLPAGAPAPSVRPVGMSEDEFNARLEDERKKWQAEARAAQRDQAARLKEFEERERQRAEAEKKAQEDAEAAQRRKDEEDLSAKELLLKREQEWNDWRRQMEAERARDRAIFEKQEAFNRLQAYRAQRIQEELRNETIPAEFTDFITGNTEDEIEASIALVQQRAQEAFSNMRQAYEQQGVRPRQPGPLTGAPPVGPPEMSRDGSRTLTLQEIEQMPMDEWARVGPAARAEIQRRYYEERGMQPRR